MPDISLTCKAEEEGDAVASSTDDNAADNEIDGAIYHKLQVVSTLDWYIICTFTRWYNKKHQRRNRMSKVGFVRNSIYEKGLKKMAGA